MKFFGFASCTDDDQNDSVGLLIEFVQGPDLRKRIIANMAFESVLYKAEIMRDIAKALNHVHDAKIVHTDVSSANILVSDRRVACVSICLLVVQSQIR